jgi:hypothetical protein
MAWIVANRTPVTEVSLIFTHTENVLEGSISKLIPRASRQSVYPIQVIWKSLTYPLDGEPEPSESRKLENSA